MQANAKRDLSKDKFAETPGKAPFPYRTAIAIFLLAGNFLIAAIYFHVINP